MQARLYQAGLFVPEADSRRLDGAFWSFRPDPTRPRLDPTRPDPTVVSGPPTRLSNLLDESVKLRNAPLE